MTDLYNECDFSTETLSEDELDELREQYEDLDDLCIVHLSFRYEDKACLWATQEHDTNYVSDEFTPLVPRSVRGNQHIDAALTALQERRERLGLDPTDPTTYPNYRQPKEAGAGGITPYQKALGEERYFVYFKEEEAA